MLPEVGSTIVPPGFSRPSCSAASIMATAGRSLTLPPGLSISSLATTVQDRPSVTRFEPHQRRVADQVEQRSAI